jgi:two-component system OmpR family response regulator
LRLLIVEDDMVLADGIQEALTQSGYLYDHAKTGPDAEKKLTYFSYDTVILDLGLPGFDGLELLKRIRAKKNHVPVLILTARDTLEDQVQGLDLGADDYLTKPFRLKELEARVRALLRRSQFSNENEICLGSLRFDIKTRSVFIDKQRIDLSSREIDVLEILLVSSGSVVSKQQFIEKLCGWNDEITTNAIEKYISRLRKKLVEADLNFKTVWGVGYLLEAENES